MWARDWKTLAAAEEALQVPVPQPVLAKRIKGRVADQMADIPVPPVMDEIMAVAQEEEEKLFPQERVQQATVEHVPVPQILEEIVEVVLASVERVQRRTVDVPMEETVELVRLVPREQVQQRTVVPMLLVLEETVEVVSLAPHERL